MNNRITYQYAFLVQMQEHPKDFDGEQLVLEQK